MRTRTLNMTVAADYFSHVFGQQRGRQLPIQVCLHENPLWRHLGLVTGGAKVFNGDVNNFLLLASALVGETLPQAKTSIFINSTRKGALASFLRYNERHRISRPSINCTLSQNNKAVNLERVLSLLENSHLVVLPGMHYVASLEQAAKSLAHLPTTSRYLAGV
jgi:hypothetical protein